jgi:hypothetical protein
MMTKEQFVNRINLIKKFYKERDALKKLINKLTDGYSIVTFGDELVYEIIETINEDMKINNNDDLIDWWLCEEVEKVICEIDDDDNEKEMEVKTPEQLYDYIIEVYK